MVDPLKVKSHPLREGSWYKVAAPETHDKVLPAGHVDATQAAHTDGSVTTPESLPTAAVQQYPMVPLARETPALQTCVLISGVAPPAHVSPVEPLPHERVESE
jgi:hypothetical protein